MPEIQAPELYTVKQVANHLGLRLDSVYRLIETRRLRATRLGPGTHARIRIDADELERFKRRGDD